jgi:hypothetical protein
MQSPRPNSSSAAFGLALLFAPLAACTGTTQQAADSAQLGGELKGGTPAGGQDKQDNGDKGKHLGQAGDGAGHGQMEAGRNAHAGRGGSEDDDQAMDESSGGTGGHGHAGNNGQGHAGDHGHGNTAGHGDEQDDDNGSDEAAAGSAGS